MLRCWKVIAHTATNLYELLLPDKYMPFQYMAFTSFLNLDSFAYYIVVFCAVVNMQFETIIHKKLFVKNPFKLVWFVPKPAYRVFIIAYIKYKLFLIKTIHKHFF